MLNNHEINCLGNIVNHTWGKSSLSSDGNISVTYRLKDNVISLQFQTIVNFASERALSEQTSRLSDESLQVLDSAISKLKLKFKDSSGSTLKLKEVSNIDDIELISATVNSPRKVAYYRRRVNFEINN